LRRLVRICCERSVSSQCPAIIPVAGAVLAEQNDERVVARRYMSAEPIAKALAPPNNEPEEVIVIAAAA